MRAIRASYEGEAQGKSSILTPELWNQIGHSLNLSPRELQIVKCIFDGEKESTISLHLGISTHTVHSHCERVYRKLQACSRSDLIVRIFEAYVTHADAFTNRRYATPSV